jgi:hypothetical protein
MTTKWAQKAAEKASSRLVFEPSTEDRRKNWCYFRGLLREVSCPNNLLPKVAFAPDWEPFGNSFF